MARDGGLPPGRLPDRLLRVVGADGMNSRVRQVLESAGGGDGRFELFCDMDGVLVDFNGGVAKLSGIPADQMDVKQLWRTVARHKYFFEDLDWTEDGRELWEAIKHLRPTLLTGVPNNKTGAVGSQKANWCRREMRCPINHVDKAAHKPQRHETVNGGRFRPGMINVVSCWTRFKHHECTRSGSILIDDRIKLKDAWEAAGGVFVHHVRTEQTLAVLADLGVVAGAGDVEAKDLEGRDGSFYQL